MIETIVAIMSLLHLVSTAADVPPGSSSNPPHK